MSIINGQKLFDLITKVISNQYNDQDLTEFVHICTSVSSAYLRIRQYYNRLYFRINDDDNKQLDNLALDAIAPIFARNEGGHFYQLRRYFKPLLDNMEEDKNLCFSFLRRLVISRTKQEMINFFRHEDPSSWRIYRNLQLAPKRNERIGVFEDFHKVYLYHKPSALDVSIPSGLQPELPEISSEKLEQLLINALKRSLKTPDIIENILMNISEDGRCRKFVSREKLFHSLKKILGLRIVSLDDYTTTALQDLDADSLSLMGKSELTKELVNFFKTIIEETYVSTSKVSYEEASAYMVILKSYFRDLIYTGSSLKLPHYMNHRLGNDVMRDRWDLHKNRLEYMIKLSKQYLRELWEDKEFRIP